MYERLLTDHILDQISHKLSQHQHGFRKKRSCLSNLLETLEHLINCLSQNEKADILYFDFSKAFDSVSHFKLLVKLENLGLSTKIRNIIKDFLTDRTFQVKVGDVFSAVMMAFSGIVQGSVLGPLLFLIFINDLPGLIHCCSKLFADDLKIIANPNDTTSTVLDLKLLEEWQETWSLSFNLQKCKVVHFLQSTEEELPNYSFFDESMTTVDNEKDLGVVFDSSLNFHQHISNCVAKAKSKFGWIKRTLVSRDMHVILQVYKHIIRPHLEYCAQVWAPVAEHLLCNRYLSNLHYPNTLIDIRRLSMKFHISL